MTLRFVLLVATVIAAAGMTIWMALVWAGTGGSFWQAAIGPVLLVAVLYLRLRKSRP